MTKEPEELYFADTLVSVKYNKTLKTLPLRLYKIYSSWWESRDKYSTQLRPMLYLPLDSHLKLYISYKLVAVL